MRVCGDTFPGFKMQFSSIKNAIFQNFSVFSEYPGFSRPKVKIQDFQDARGHQEKEKVLSAWQNFIGFCLSLMHLGAWRHRPADMWGWIQTSDTCKWLCSFPSHNPLSHTHTFTFVSCFFNSVDLTQHSFFTAGLYFTPNMKMLRRPKLALHQTILALHLHKQLNKGRFLLMVGVVIYPNYHLWLPPPL